MSFFWQEISRGGWGAAPPSIGAVLDRRFQRLYQVGLFPAKATVRIGLAAKMAIGGCALIDWLVQLQMLSDAPGGEVHGGLDGLFDLFVRCGACAEGIAINRQGF